MKCCARVAPGRDDSPMQHLRRFNLLVAALAVMLGATACASSSDGSSETTAGSLTADAAVDGSSTTSTSAPTTTSEAEPTTTSEAEEVAVPQVSEFPATIEEFILRWNDEVAVLEAAQLELAPESESTILEVTDALRLGEPFDHTFDDGTTALRSDGVPDAMFVQFEGVDEDGSFSSAQLFTNGILLGSSGLPTQVLTLGRIMMVTAVHGSEFPTTVLSGLSELQQALSDSGEFVSVVYGAVEWEAGAGILLTATPTDAEDTIEYIHPESSSGDTEPEESDTEDVIEAGCELDPAFEARSEDFKAAFCALDAAVPFSIRESPEGFAIASEALAQLYEEGRAVKGDLITLVVSLGGSIEGIEFFDDAN